MGNWKRLDLRSSADRPLLDELVVLRLVSRDILATERYDIGRFRQDRHTGQKLWWYGARGCEDPANLKKHNHIWWCYAPKF